MSEKPQDTEQHLAPQAKETISEIITELAEVFAFARNRWSRYAEEVHAELKGVGMVVLHAILRNGPITATELSRRLDMDKSMISRQIARLRDLDLIVETPSPQDGRIVLLEVSAGGREAIRELRSRTAEDYAERFQSWTPGELDELRKSLARFNRHGDDSAGS